MNKVENLKEYLIGQLRIVIRSEKTKMVNPNFLDGQRNILRNILEDFFMTREEVGIIINETWSE